MGAGDAVEVGGLVVVDEVGVFETWVVLVLEGSDVVVEDFFLSAAAIAEERKRRLKSQWIWMSIFEVVKVFEDDAARVRAVSLSLGVCRPFL